MNRITIERKLDKSLLNGIVDTHIHSAPDVRKRKFNDLEIAAEAEKYGVAAIVLKSHHVSTVERAIVAQMTVKKTRVYGGLALNVQTGGLNIAAVESALEMGGKIIWMPTLSASHQHAVSGKSGGIECIKDGEVVDALKAIIRLIAEKNAILATGHLSPEEQLVLVQYASENGVKKIIVAHPELMRISMSLDIQRRLSEYGVYFERCYTCNLEPKETGYRKNVEAAIAGIRELSAANTIIASDLGQTVNPDWSDAMADYIEGLYEAGFSREEVERMTIHNPLSLLMD